MSASLSGSGQMNDWLLPLPGDIVSNDSFAQDLIRQFDQKRSRLHLELTLPEVKTVIQSAWVYSITGKIGPSYRS